MPQSHWEKQFKTFLFFLCKKCLHPLLVKNNYKAFEVCHWEEQKKQNDNWEVVFSHPMANQDFFVVSAVYSARLLLWLAALAILV